jgi:integrator complex subunit 11
MIIMPGYCVAGTIGHKILNGQKRIEFEKGQVTEVKMSVQYMSFSAHADAKGIMQLISWCEPRNVMLVHGEGEKMKFLKSKIKAEHGIDCFMPANGETAVIPGRTTVPARVSVSLLEQEAAVYALEPPDSKRTRLLHGVMLVRGDGSFTLEEPQAAAAQLGVTPHTVRFTTKVSLEDGGEVEAMLGRVQAAAQARLQGSGCSLVRDSEGDLTVRSVTVQVEQAQEEGVKDVRVAWEYTDDYLGSTILQAIQSMH